MLLWAIDQPAYLGARQTRFAAVRATYPALKSTLIKTWKNWFPEQHWPVKQSIPFETKVMFGLSDGTYVEMEVVFIAIETEDDVKKLKSLELTGGFINEAFEVDRTVVTTLYERTGRYPPRNPSTGQPGPKRRGVWCDTNSPHEKHWWAAWEKNPPEGMKFYVQPPPLIRRLDEDGNTIGWDDNPEAENVRNLGLGTDKENPTEAELRAAGYDYYRKQIPGLTEDELQVNIENKFGSIFGGKAVYRNEWKQEMISRREGFDPTPGQEIIVGIDTSGLNPAGVFMQESMSHLGIFHEIVALDTDFDTFVEEMLIPTLRKPRFVNCPILCVCDPANPKNFKTGHTAVQILNRLGLRAVVAPTNDPTIRIDAVKYYMRLRDGLLVQEDTCPMLLDGFKGGYHFKKIKGSGVGYKERPEKDKFAHPQDAVQYGAVWLRRAHLLTGGDTESDTGGTASRYRKQRGKRNTARAQLA